MKLFFSLIRALFPKWNFFDRISSEYHLEIKKSGSEDWVQVGLPVKRSWSSLFFNPEGNLVLAQVSLLEAFARDVEERGEEGISNLVTYKMVRSLVEELGYPDGSFRVVEE